MGADNTALEQFIKIGGADNTAREHFITISGADNTAPKNVLNILLKGWADNTALKILLI